MPCSTGAAWPGGDRQPQPRLRSTRRDRICGRHGGRARGLCRLPAPGAPLAIVVNDRLGLYGGILERAGLLLESRTLRHVNRRTGRRAGEYFEEILVARRAG